MATDAIVALGTNLGDRLENLAEALRLIGENEFCEVVSVSHAFESAPWGITDQPGFANAAAVVRTTLRADDLLGELQSIERSMGRESDGPRNGPRLIDLDILLFGDEEWDTLGLKVPHPRMAERDFAIIPLLEIRPEANYPDGSPVTRDDVRVGRVSDLLGMIPGFEDRTPARTDDSDPADDLPPRIRPLPGEDWATVYEYGDDPTFFGLGRMVARGESPLGGGLPQVESSFVEMVLDQEGIPHAWDPFPPSKTSDPYGFKRRYSIKVPSSLADRAMRTIQSALDAPVDWSDVEDGPED